MIYHINLTYSSYNMSFFDATPPETNRFDDKLRLLPCQKGIPLYHDVTM